MAPIDSNGMIQMADFERFIDRRRRAERGEEEEASVGDDGAHSSSNANVAPAGSADTQDPSTMSVVAPTPRDVLLGRGKPYQDFIGNIRFGLLVDQYLDRHNMAPKFEKTILSMSVVQTVKNRNGRFLKKNKETDMWDVVSDDAARDKVAHAFRTKTQRSNDNNRDGNTKKKRPKLS